MTVNASPSPRKLNTAARTIILGLLLEAVTLYWSNPTSFLLFVGAGALLVFVGVAMYLVAIVKM